MDDRDEITLWGNARLATCAGAGLGLIERGALVTQAGRIVFAGQEAEAPHAERHVDCGGRWITPALIDCHTHLVYGGDRAREFELRLAGANYEEIAKAGGGIISTVVATRGAKAGARAQRGRADDVPWRPRAAAGVQRPPRGLHRSDMRRDAASARRRGFG